MAALPITRESLAQWLGRLVRIPSVSPDQACPRAGVPGEAVIGAAVADFMTQLGGKVSFQEVYPGRPNVIGFWQGSSSRVLAVDVHMDTVGVQTMTGDPFDGRYEDGKVFGRGAVDTKATLAIVLAILEAVQSQGLKLVPSVLIAATSDEEVGAAGAPALARWLKEQNIVVDEMIVAEPTQCGPVHGHKGVVRSRFTVQGKAAHSSRPELGANAINAAMHLIVAFEQENKRLAELPLTGLATQLGAGTLTTTLISAGQGANVVPPSCSLSIDRRLTAGEDALSVQARLATIAQEACPLPVTVEHLLGLDPFARDAGSVWMKQLAQWSGSEPAVVSYGTNAFAYPQSLVKDCAVVGPGSIEQAHGNVEWVTLDELERMAGIYMNWWEL